MSSFFQFVLQGTSITLAVTAVALPLGLMLGILFALFYLYGGKILRMVMYAYSTVMRGIPPIVLLFIFGVIKKTKAKCMIRNV